MSFGRPILGAGCVHEWSLGRDAWDKQVGLAGNKEESAPGGVSGLFADNSGIG